MVEASRDLHNQIGRLRLDRVAGDVVAGTLLEILPSQMVANQTRELNV